MVQQQARRGARAATGHDRVALVDVNTVREREKKTID